MADRVGQQFGNYRLITKLGEGGFAEVYFGGHMHQNTLAAIKVLRAPLPVEDAERLRVEAHTIARLNHPNIVHILDFGVEDTIPFLVMDYAPNGTLSQRHPKGLPLPPATILSYVKQVAAALQYAHNEQVMHGDIKPENMLFGQNNELLLSDFGLSRIAQSIRYLNTQDIARTARYLSPEQIQGKPDFASDQYALGIVVYEWICGDSPFHGNFQELCSQHLSANPPSLRAKAPMLPPGLEEVLLVALAKNPRQRFSCVQEFANALLQAGGIAPIRGGSSSPDLASLAVPLRNQYSASPTPSGPAPSLAAPLRSQYPASPTPPGPAPSMPPPVGSQYPVSSELEPEVEAPDRSRRLLVLAVAVGSVAALGGGAWGLIRLLAAPEPSAPTRTWASHQPVGEGVSSLAPALTVWNSTLYAAFADAHNSNNLTLVSSTDGIDWTFSLDIGQSSSVTPALSVWNNVLYIAFAANNSSSNLVCISSADGVHWSNPRPIGGQGSSAAPALSVWNNVLYAAFVDTHNNNRLTLVSSTDGLHWTGNLIIGPSSSLAPTLTVWNKTLYAAFVDTRHSNNLMLASSTDGLHWSGNLTIGQTSLVAPALVVWNKTLYIAFVADNLFRDLLLVSSTDGVHWSDNQSIGGESSTLAPALTVWDKTLYASFTSNDFSKSLLLVSSKK